MTWGKGVEQKLTKCGVGGRVKTTILRVIYFLNDSLQKAYLQKPMFLQDKKYSLSAIM